VKLSGTVHLPAKPPRVWALLTDPQRLARLLPGCERLEADGPNRFKVVTTFGVAAISGRYSGGLEFKQMTPPSALTLRFDGRGLPGFVRGEASVDLAANSSGTELRYSGEAQVGGVIAGVGQRLLEAAARKIVQQFFEAAAAELAATPEGAETSAPHADRPRRARKRS
jgi:uncharacterized protein